LINSSVSSVQPSLSVKQLLLTMVGKDYGQGVTVFEKQLLLDMASSIYPYFFWVYEILLFDWVHRATASLQVQLLRCVV